MTSQIPPRTNNLSPAISSAEKYDADYFDTSHLKADIKGHSVRGGAVTITAQAFKFLLQTGSTSVLARLLTPADFGLIAMVSVFTEFVNLFKDLGLSMATIQRKDITHEQVSNLFWVNIGMSIFLMMIAAAISPFIAYFYDEPRLTLITIALGGTFIFGGLIAQHTALMRRQMRFTALAIVEIVSMIIGIIAAIIAALLGFTYWSLVIMVAARGITSVYMVWKFSPWRPGRLTRGSNTRPMLAFGGSLTGSSVLNYFTCNGDNMIIGYALGSATLGIYTKAYALLTMPMSQFNGPLRSIMIPALSRLQDEPERYRQYFLKALAAIALIAMPLVTFMFVSADEIVYILLGSQWSSAATVFRFLAPAAFFMSISFAPQWLFVSLGRTADQFRWTLISAIIMITGFLVGVNWGINGVAASVSITYSAMFIIALFWATHTSPVKFLDIVRFLAVPIVSSILAAFVAALIGRFVEQYNVVVRLIVYILTFAISYMGCIIATSQGRELAHSMLNAISEIKVNSTIEKVAS